MLINRGRCVELPMAFVEISNWRSKHQMYGSLCCMPGSIWEGLRYLFLNIDHLQFPVRHSSDAKHTLPLLCHYMYWTWPSDNLPRSERGFLSIHFLPSLSLSLPSEVFFKPVTSLRKLHHLLNEGYQRSLVVTLPRQHQELAQCPMRYDQSVRPMESLSVLQG